MPSFPNPNANITFGMEFEFMSPCPTTEPPFQRRGQGVRARIHLAKLMTRHTPLSIATQCGHSRKTKCPNCDEALEGRMYGDLRVFSTDKTRWTNQDFKANHFIFCLEFLRSFEGINATRMWPGIEFITPAFKYGELAAGLPTVNTAISGLRNIGASITADQTCGLHVHVGVESGMTRLIAKKAISLVMMLEQTMLYPLVAPSRLQSECAKPVTEVSVAAVNGFIKVDRHLEKVRSQDNGNSMNTYIPQLETIKLGKWRHQVAMEEMYRALQAIWNGDSLQELNLLLQRVIKSRTALAICLRNHHSEPVQSDDSTNLENSPSTIEFRYAQMSFDKTFIHNWVQLVCRIVEIAQLGATDYRIIVSKILKTLDTVKDKDKKPIWGELLTILHLKHQVEDWKSQVAMYKAGVEIVHLDDELLLMSERGEEGKMEEERTKKA